ncbi:MAG TPA: protein kinase [Natronosporangium sp.]|nr:protein kinase [Natronosporangium sp.]
MSLLSTGLRLDDRYTVVDRLGAGGMSEVWRATDALLERQVAVKVLAAPLADDPSLREVIRREARAAAQLSHPHIAAVHDYGEATLPDGRVLPYLVMELVTGETLADRLARQGPLPWPEAARVVSQVAAALAAAHARGVVHRDVTPANVMLVDGEVKVLDFGVAAVAGGDDTDPGQRRGTPQYVAPERLDPTHPATPAGDLYSLGVLLYEVIVGRPPVSIVDWTQAAAVHRSGFTPPELGVPGLPGEVARLCRACLSPEPTQRPAAAVVARTLAGLAPGTQVLRYAMGSAPLPTQPVPAPVPTSPRPGRSRRLRQWGGLAAAAVVVVALGILLGRALWPAPGPDSGVVADPPGAADQAGESATPPGEAPGGVEQSVGNPLAGAMGAIQALDQVVVVGEERGVITPAAAEELQEHLQELREAVRERDAEEFIDAVDELREEIAELEAAGELDPQVAAELIGLLMELPLL